ncbi:MAG TPA: hypothetical protein VFR23_19655 [Jiangellaceae bacterium]|nr:hypothetical protein [Jiangellaceae bacterium]
MHEYEMVFTICHDIFLFVYTISVEPIDIKTMVEPIDIKTMTGDRLHQRMFS